ncbi:MAG: hypothetical protein Q8O65_02235 [Nitrosopumilaceae archaeon]|nr:hypothetical protein [Nitrosopumilaceae archaeon]
MGIESTAHTFACAVVEKNGKIHSDVRKITGLLRVKAFIHVRNQGIT